MLKDIVVAKWQDDNLKIINIDLLPLYFRYSHDVFKWIKIRAIDSKRPNSRLLIKLFNELMAHDENLKKYISALSEDLIKSVIKSVGMRVKSNEITNFIMNGYNLIEK